MLNQATVVNKPWCCISEYNVITAIDEKLGGVPNNMRKSLDFISFVEACGLMEIGFSGQKITWSNKRGINHKISKKLDKALANDSWMEMIAWNEYHPFGCCLFLSVPTSYGNGVQGSNTY